MAQRCFEERFAGFYFRVVNNFYLLQLVYVLAFATLNAFAPGPGSVLLLGLQGLMLLLVLWLRPHFNPFEKLRGCLTWLTLAFGTFAVLARPTDFLLVRVLLALLSLHLLASVLVIAQSLFLQLKRKCNDRSEVVKNLMKEGYVESEKQALREIILRFQNLENPNLTISQEVSKIQHNFQENFGEGQYSCDPADVGLIDPNDGRLLDPV